VLKDRRNVKLRVLKMSLQGLTDHRSSSKTPAKIAQQFLLGKQTVGPFATGIRRTEKIYSGNEFLSRGRERLVFYEATT